MKLYQIIATLFVIGFAFVVAENEKDPYEEFLNICYTELETYDECYLSYYDEIPPDELKKNCDIFKSEKCQNYWDDPLKYVPTCKKAISRSVSKLNRMDETRAEYDEVCAQVIEAKSDEKTEAKTGEKVEAKAGEKIEAKTDEKVVIPTEIPANDSDKKQEDLKSAASTVTYTSALMILSLLLLIINY